MQISKCSTCNTKPYMIFYLNKNVQWVFQLHCPACSKSLTFLHDNFEEVLEAAEHRWNVDNKYIRSVPYHLLTQEIKYD